MLARDNGRLIKNLRDAKLRIADACMEGIDCPRARDLDKALVRTLTTCRWIAEHQTVIVTGATGPARATSGARSPTRRVAGLRASTVACRVSSTSCDSRADGSYPRMLARIAKIDVLVLDDSRSPAHRRSRRDLLEILEDRYGLRATVICSSSIPRAGTTTSRIPPSPTPSATRLHALTSSRSRGRPAQDQAGHRGGLSTDPAAGTLRGAS